MKRKGQAAMEFLMTYGWAILVVLLAIGALAYFGVLSPQKILPERTVFTAPLPNLDNAQLAATGATIEVAFKNNKGVPINITGAAGIPTTHATCNAVSGVTATDTSGANITGTSISNGANFILTWACSGGSRTAGDAFKGDLSFEYKNTETGQTITHSGSVDGSWK